MQKAEVLCTTDDPTDTLEYHKKLKEEGFEIAVLPTFRPEKAIAMLNDMLDNAPYDLGAWHSLGEAYLANEDFQKALEAADFALAIDENDGQALLLKAN